MYQIESLRSAFGGRTRVRPRRARVGRNVVLIGLTSMFTDISAEMVATILPLYLVYSLGFSPLQFGLIDGIYQGAGAVVRVLAGFTADRTRRHKEVAAAGYGLSATCKLGYLAAGGAFTPLSAVVLLDRAGKGIRTAPRDALISLSAPGARLATAFGVHRALDTAGALIGPFVAFAILFLAPRAFDAVFVASFCFALIGLGILVLFVQNRSARDEGPDEAVGAVSPRAVAGLLGVRAFRRLVLAAGALGLVTISDGFLYLMLQRRLDLDVGYFPLLYVGTALVYMVFAIPVARLADWLGRKRTFLGGYAVLLAAYGALLVPEGSGFLDLAVVLGLVGLFYAATDGVLMAIASSILPAELRASGLSLLVTATSVARLFASLLFGAAWTWLGVQAAIAAFMVGLAVALCLSGVALVGAKVERAHA